MQPFDSYPYGGRVLLSTLPSGSSRGDYGARLQQLTGQSHCAYCGLNLIEDYDRWLQLCVDHVVSIKAAVRLGIPVNWSQNPINLVLACRACNEFDNQYKVAGEPKSDWSFEEFLKLRNEVFSDRMRRIQERHAREKTVFARLPWQRSGT